MNGAAAGADLVRKYHNLQLPSVCYDHGLRPCPVPCDRVNGPGDSTMCKHCGGRLALLEELRCLMCGRPADELPPAALMPIKPENRRRYPKDWALRSRFVREVRARGRCEWCGAANGQPHPVTGSRVVLTAAHVHDRDPAASSLLNLAALCQRCHNRHDIDQRLEGRGLRRRRRPRGRQGRLL